MATRAAGVGTTTVLVVATDRDACVSSARRVEAAAEDVEAAGATCTEGVREALAAADVDCVVFAENPLTADEAPLPAVTDLCEGHAGEGSVPVVLFTDGSYGPATARATDGVDGYVRADAENAYAHLADEIRWATTGDESTAWYEPLVESMEDGVLVFDATGRIRYANGAMTDVLGVDADLEDAPVGTLAEGPAAVEGLDAIEAAVESVLAGEAESLSPEVTVEPPEDDEEPRVVEFRVVTLPAARDGAVATVRNVTEYRQTASALRETRSRIEHLHAVTDEMGACRSERELFELAADAADRIFDADLCGIDTVQDGQFRPQVVLGGHYDPGPIAGVAGRAHRAGESILVEDAGDRPDAAPVPDPGSVLVVPIESAALLRVVADDPESLDERDRDLAELLAAHVGESLTRIRVGRTLRQREQDLLEERERLVSLFENVPIPLASYVFEGGRPVIREVNPSFESVFGVDADRVAGDPLREHVRPPAGDGSADGEGATDPVDPASLDDRLRAGERLETAVRRETASGPRDFLLHAGPLVDAASGEEGFLAYTDISTQKDRERELARHGDVLAEFADVAAGDLRDWLNEARAYLELAGETGDEADVAAVRQAHERMARLVDDLETLVDGDRAVEPQDLALETAATRAWAGVETGPLDLAVADGTVEADPDRLDDLLQQLLRNVVDHAAPDRRDDAVLDPLSGGLDADADLTVRVGPLSDREGFYVEDDGTGIDPEHRERVFDPGYTTDPQAAGLGLGVVRDVVEDHGWSVQVRESAAGGARFEFVTGADPRARRRRAVPSPEE